MLYFIVVGDKCCGLCGGVVGGGVGIFCDNNNVFVVGVIFNGGIEVVVGGVVVDDELLNVVFVQYLCQ